jgi:uncharacterized membrane protein YhaH (DUF805 family)
MTFVGAITTCLRKYAVFSGRATRAEFWWWVLAVFIVSIAVSIVDGVISAVTGGKVEEVLSAVFFLAVLLPNLTVTVRRLHDIGKTGWWLLLWIVAGIGPWVVLAGLVMVAVWGSLVAAGSAPGPAEFFFELLTGLALIWILAILGLIFAILVSLAIVIWQIVWLARQGEAGANRHGPDPRAA